MKQNDSVESTEAGVLADDDKDSHNSFFSRRSGENLDESEAEEASTRAQQQQLRTFSIKPSSANNER